MPITTVECAGKTLDLSYPQVMGVLNVTPDSFSDGGQYQTPQQALQRALQMQQQGAAIIDVGGESTRPGAERVSLEEELRRVIPVIKLLAQHLSVPISIDSRKPEVMRAAIEAGAGMINDVNALQEQGAAEIAIAHNIPVCIMHMQGEPATMQTGPAYTNVVNEVFAFLQQRVMWLLEKGIPENKIFIDPGFGFGKTVQHNLLLLHQLTEFKKLNLPILVGLSRKSMIGKLLSRQVPQRLAASLALAVIAVENGASMVRAHDVQETVDAIQMHTLVRQAKS